MFIQVIQGKTKDAEGLRRQFDSWTQEVGPGTKGWLGTTGGIAEDGTVIVLARFEDEAAARANSDRPEQGNWWNETAKYFDGEPTLLDTTDTETTLAGGSDTAGFVQVMQGRVKDKAKLQQLEKEWLPKMTEARPDVIGSVRAWQGNEFTEALYFTSEAEARKGEASMSESGGDADMAEYMALLDGEITYIDLKDPILRSP